MNCFNLDTVTRYLSFLTLENYVYIYYMDMEKCSYMSDAYLINTCTMYLFAQAAII